MSDNGNKDNPTLFEGFSVPEGNFYKTPNVWIDICAGINNLAEIKVIQYVLRHTWGFSEYGIAKKISVDEFMHGRCRTDRTRMDAGTGLSHMSVIDGLKRAVAHGYLFCEVDTSDPARIKKSYGLKMIGGVKDLEGVKNLDPLKDLEGVKNLAGDVKDLYPRYKGSLDRTEKDTLEKHLKKEDTVSADAPVAAAAVSLSPAKNPLVGTMFPIADATTEIRVQGITLPHMRALGSGPALATASQLTETSSPPVLRLVPPHTPASEQEEEQAAPPDSLNDYKKPTEERGVSPEEVQGAAPGKPAATKKAAAPKAKKPPVEKKVKEVAPPEPTLEEQLSPEAKLVLKSWRSLFTAPVDVIPAVAKAAENLVPAARKWCPLLGNIGLPEFLKLLKDHAFEYSGDYYRGRGGVKLFDIPRELEGWESMKERELALVAKAAQAAGPTATAQSQAEYERQVVEAISRQRGPVASTPKPRVVRTAAW